MDTDPFPLYDVGITYNLKKGIKSDIEDNEAEYDNFDTVSAIKNAIEKTGCRVKLFEADNGLFDKLRDDKVDIIFNIAEGIYGRGREAQVPAILNYLKIRYTGSDETTLCISLDKALTKRLLSISKIKTPEYTVIDKLNSKINFNAFPAIIKPNAEGSSKGISDIVIANNIDELNKIVNRELSVYEQPVLVEQYIDGREFTVGIIGNGDDVRVFSPMEIIYKNSEVTNKIYSFNVKKNYKKYIDYKCPADLDSSINNKIMKTASKIYKELQCKDFSRVDFRLSKDNDIYFIEINPLPGLAPGYSDYPMLANFCGVNYDELIKMILNSALKRYALKPVH